ncbi:hypothetical protein M0804_003638 [Polistes exclamans]|nr:hypothetical protein M0804_003638 [Polistes exclamans]
MQEGAVLAFEYYQYAKSQKWINAKHDHVDMNNISEAKQYIIVKICILYVLFYLTFKKRLVLSFPNFSLTAEYGVNKITLPPNLNLNPTNVIRMVTALEHHILLTPERHRSCGKDIIKVSQAHKRKSNKDDKDLVA